MILFASLVRKCAGCFEASHDGGALSMTRTKSNFQPPAFDNIVDISFNNAIFMCLLLVHHFKLYSSEPNGSKHKLDEYKF